MVQHQHNKIFSDGLQIECGIDAVEVETHLHHIEPMDPWFKWLPWVPSFWRGRRKEVKCGDGGMGEKGRREQGGSEVGRENRREGVRWGGRMGERE